MSQWRRIAIEEMPSFKRLIERAKNPNAMWLELYDELTIWGKLEENTKWQVYKFALQCQRSGRPVILANSVWLFLHHAVGGYIIGVDMIRQDLPKYLSEGDFYVWANATKEDFNLDKFYEATKQFKAAKYQTK